MAITFKQRQEIIKAFGNTEYGNEFSSAIDAKGGTLTSIARRHVDLVVASKQISKRICDIVDAGTGTLAPSDSKALIIGLGEQGIGAEVVKAINGA